MKLRHYKLVFIAIGLAGILLIASTTIGSIIPSVGGEQYSEIFLLDIEGKTKNYPYDLEEGHEYSVFVGVGNHMTSLVYYVLQVKIGNQTDLLPNLATTTPSPLEPLYEYKFFVADNETWEAPLDFSISDVSFMQNQAIINRISINDVEFVLNKEIGWNADSKGFYFKLFIELWIFNPQSNSIEFYNRFVNMKLNLTQTA